jgi:hypothetical protein
MAGTVPDDLIAVSMLVDEKNTNRLDRNRRARQTKRLARILSVLRLIQS